MSALRTVRSLAAASSRTLAQRSVIGGAQRSVLSCSTLARALQCQKQWAVPAVRAFSISARTQKEGASDVSLSQKLQEELNYERGSAQAGQPEFIKDFVNQGVWTIDDTLGNDEVAFVRKFGNETIRLLFSISDLNASESDREFEMEQRVEAGEEADPEQQTISPCRVQVIVTKSDTPGSMNIDTMCQDVGFLIEHVGFFNDALIGTEVTAEMDWKRRGLYSGPSFDHLDPEVQEEFEKFLDERGINEALAIFLHDYAEYKEQTEYVSWIEKVQKFVEN
ncbi:hypothetical protein EW145_g350 [Phellinidium pouzarii]|uniref:Mitochondrial glyco protein n=1 Tax=Phellinidium pouzarii TaxID=167371 RepID=A0A4S4LJE4_9AGAM|nr:hypothetical protein EW145_g350 [Phellinidium pouzarii]